MATYNENDAVLLKHLVDLGERVKDVTDDIDSRVEDLESVDAEHNVIVGVKKNGVDVQPGDDRKVDIIVPTNTNELTNGAGFQTKSEVDDAINAKISSVYKPGGSKNFSELTDDLLTEDYDGMVYNVKDNFETTTDFIEGPGHKYPAGTNVVVVEDGATYKFDVLAGVVDLSNYMERVSSATAGNLVKLKEDGSLETTDIPANKVITEHQNIDGKADKANPAVADNLASLDSNGNLKDSGIAKSSVVTDVSGKMDKLSSSATEGNIVLVGADGAVKDSGFKFATDTDVKAALDEIFPEI